MHIRLTRPAGGYSILVERRACIVTLVFETTIGLEEHGIGIYWDKKGLP